MLFSTPPIHRFQSDDVEIAYHDEGPRDGVPVMLVHGFGSNARVNWVQTGWFETLTAAGYRTIALDNRGHGRSAGPHDPAAYDPQTKMAEDVRRLMDHLRLPHTHVMGYSMGAWITAYLALRHPERLRTAVFGGLAGAMLHGLSGQAEIVAALTADDPTTIATARGRTYRDFADRTKSDRLALAACMGAARRPVPAEDLRRLTLPVLIVVGTLDDVAGPLDDLAGLLPQARTLSLPGRDHMSAVGDKGYKAGVLDFLARHG